MVCLESPGTSAALWAVRRSRPRLEYGVSKIADPMDQWVYRSSEQADSRLRLICLPYAGGGAAVYRLWSEVMPPGIDVCRVQLPGRETRLREKPYDRLANLLDALLEVVSPLLDVPFVIFGHSMGALTGFELARAIRRETGLSPKHFFASGWRAPQIGLGTALHGLPDPEFVERLQARFSGIPAGVLEDPELLELMLPILRADLAICETYQFADELPLDCPITVFGGQEDYWTSATDLAAWAGHTADELNVKMFPGDHFFINDPRQLVARQVAEVLSGMSVEFGANA